MSRKAHREECLHMTEPVHVPSNSRFFSLLTLIYIRLSMETFVLQEKTHKNWWYFGIFLFIHVICITMYGNLTEKYSFVRPIQVNEMRSRKTCLNNFVSFMNMDEQQKGTNAKNWHNNLAYTGALETLRVTTTCHWIDLNSLTGITSFEPLGNVMR